MSYPRTPWNAHGDALYTMRLVEVARVRPLIPAPFEIVSIVPGKTLCSVYFADYQPGSDLVYHELIVAAAMVRFGRQTGAWISHIYVDNPDSMAGGREIWGLPKELARFEWNLTSGRVEAWMDNQLLCAFESKPPAWKLPIPVVLPYISLLGNQVLAAKSTLTHGIGISRAKVIVPDSSPFAGYQFDGTSNGYHHQTMAFRADGPKVIGKLESRPAKSEV